MVKKGKCLTFSMGIKEAFAKIKYAWTKQESEEHLIEKY